MTTKVVNVLKQGGISLLLIIGLLSCEGKIDDVGVNIVDNDIFEEGKYTSEVVSYNKNIEKRLANKLNQYLLGVYKNDDFGQLDASVISQITFNNVIDFGLDPSIDAIIVDIPYYSTQDGTNDNGTPKFKLDSIIGDQETAFTLKVSELQTYLNTLDPERPSEELDYFTNDEYAFNMTPFYSGLFVPNANDTVLYVERPEVIIDWDTFIQGDRDTIKKVNGSPSIKIPLEEDFFEDNFFDNPTAFESNAAFVAFFNGLYIEASQGIDPESSLMTLDFSGATMSIYFTNSILTNETISSTDSEGNVTIISQIDYNGDGDTTDEDVPVRTKQTASFNFGGVTINKYERSNIGSNAEQIINNSNPISGGAQLVPQGAAGSIALLDLFTETGDNLTLAELRNNNWLINDASLIFYVDQSADMSIAPDRLLLYNDDENTHLTDLLFEGIATYGGALELDDNGDPYRYKFNVTDYVSKVLAFSDAENPSILALKVFNNSDFPSDFADNEVEDYSWNPKGIILLGNTTTDVEKRVKLEINYTEINN